LETKLFLRPSAEDARLVARAITGSGSGAEADRIMRMALELQNHQAIMRNQRFLPYVLANTIPHYQR
jgi:hypothetical protein